MDTLTRMRAFIDVVEAEGFSAAARKIGRSKALLSKYVRELEDELGALLLNRTTRQFSLTEAGHTYYRRAAEIVREVDSLADAVRESSGDVRGRIKLSAPRTFGDAAIGQSLIDFAVQHPEIVLEIHLDDRFVDLVEEGFDLAIRITRLESSSLIARRLAPFSVRVCASPELIAQARQAGAAAGPGASALHHRHQRPLDVELAVPRRRRRDGHASACPVRSRSTARWRRAPRRWPGSASASCRISSPRPTSRPASWSPCSTTGCPKGGGIFAVYPHRRYLPAKVRVFVDFLVQWFKAIGKA